MAQNLNNRYFSWKVMLEGVTYTAKLVMDEPSEIHVFVNSLFYKDELDDKGKLVPRGLQPRNLSDVARLHAAYDYDRILVFLKPRFSVDETTPGLTVEKFANAITQVDRFTEEFFTAYHKGSMEAIFPGVQLGPVAVSVQKSD